MTDEPVGYLGGNTGDDDPYGAPEDDPHNHTATEDPYGDYALPPASAPEEEVVGYLGGEPEELPALPPVEEGDSAYSHSDFLGQEAQPEYDDPYAGEDYEDPYQMPAGDTPLATGYDDYGDYEGAPADGDPSYFDSLGHSDEAETGMATQTEVGYDTEEFADDDQPKTISQQDAESIIRRITTKRILPPEQQAAQSMPRPQPLTPGGGGLRIWPILLVLLALGAGGVWMFREQLGLVSSGPGEAIVPQGNTIPPNELKKRELLRLVLLGECKAFGVDYAKAEKDAVAEEASAKTNAGTGAEQAPAPVKKTEEGK
ncbi:MAG: hypothetical protein AB7N76_30235 [Planctomycetota bacterium]